MQPLGGSRRIPLKSGRPSAQSGADARKVREIVTGILEDIQQHGEIALREISEKFDKWNPPTFRLPHQELEDSLSQLTPQNIEDIRFAQTQVRNFAQVQRSALKDVEVETLLGVILGHKNMPVELVGCYVPGGKYPLLASAHMSVVTAKVAGVPRVIGERCSRLGVLEGFFAHAEQANIRVRRYGGRQLAYGAAVGGEATRN